jgi:hypothetical protein
MRARPGPTSTPTRSDLSPSPPHHPTPTPARLPAPARLRPVKFACQWPRSNCSPAWSAPPRRRLLCSRRLPELLHASAVLSPRPWSGQANTPPPLHPGRPPRPGPTATWRGRLLYVVASSATGTSLSSSTPRPPCRPGPGPVKPTRHHLYAPVQLQPGMAGSSTLPPPLQPVPPRAPPRPGRPVAPAPVWSSQRVAASMPRPYSTPRSVPPRSLARPGSSTSLPNHRPPSSTSVQCLSATQLGPTALDVTGPAASSGRH